MMSQNFPFHPELDMSQFRVLNPNLISYSTSELRVCARCLSFNVATIIELGYPTHVCLCSTYDGQQIVLKAFSESELKTVEDLALPFYRRDDTQPKKRITMASKAIADSVRLTMGWDSSTVMKTKGIFYPSHQLILFDLRQASLSKNVWEKAGSTDRIPYLRRSRKVSSAPSASAPHRQLALILKHWRHQNMENTKLIERFEAEMAKIHRTGIEDLITYIRQSDFFTAPASTRFHLSCPGGLLQHSINVLDALRGLLDWNENEQIWEYRVAGHVVDSASDESVTLMALLHDLCKINFYSVRSHTVKNQETGQWEEKPYYVVEDQMPLGHGDKSVLLISKYINLTDQELYSIWHHMGFVGQDYAALKSVDLSIQKHPMVLALQTADMMASKLMEGNEENCFEAEKV